MNNGSVTSEGCYHDNGLNGLPLTSAQQFQLDWVNYSRWAIGPLGTKDQYVVKWKTYHKCMDH